MTFAELATAFADLPACDFDFRSSPSVVTHYGYEFAVVETAEKTTYRLVDALDLHDANLLGARLRRDTGGFWCVWHLPTDRPLEHCGATFRDGNNRVWQVRSTIWK